MLDVSYGIQCIALQELRECLTDEVTHVISDRPESQFPSAGNCAGQAGPPSPWTITPTPSPATSNPGDSASDRKRCPTAPNSRAQAILAKVKPSGSRHTSLSVLEKAKSLDCSIWSLAKTVVWFEKFKQRYGAIASLQKSEEPRRSGKRQLVTPCLKLENECNNTRPLYSELKAWPELYFNGRPGSSPFSVPSDKQKSAKQLAKRLDVEREQPKKILKKEETPAKKKSGGFCEICNLSFGELEKHLSSEQHQQFVTNPDNWKELDESISQAGILSL